MEKRELGYSGWANYETYLVSEHEYIEEFVDIYYDQKARPDEVDEGDLHDYFLDMVDMPSSGIIAEIVSNSVSRIDWREIAEHVKEQLEWKIVDEY